MPANLYQVRRFIGDSWKEWNGHRDDVALSSGATLQKLADCFVGSPQIGGHERREPEQSINFVTCHDGFTLNDLVSYDQKHNAANGEENRDGSNDNLSWNCGVEGPSDDPAIEILARTRQIKNFLAITLLSIGIPMISTGDEVRRTQFGNNNAYCQDNEIGWFDWSLVSKHPDILRFTSLLNERRLLRTVEHEQQRRSLVEIIDAAEKSWHGTVLSRPDWAETSNSVALSVRLKEEGLFVYFIFNAYRQGIPLSFPAIPPGDAGSTLPSCRLSISSTGNPLR